MNAFFENRSCCPVCRSGRSQTLVSLAYDRDPIRQRLMDFYEPQGLIELEYLKEQEYCLIRCRECGFLFQKEIPGKMLMQRLYEIWIDPGKARTQYESSRTGRFYLDLATEMTSVLQCLSLSPHEAHMLDIGMGWGAWCRMAAAFGCHVCGTEYSRSRREYAEKQGVRVIDLPEAVASSYDYVRIEQVLEHVPDPSSLLREAVRVLKPNGIIRIAVPNGETVPRLLMRPDWLAPKHSPESLIAVAPLEHVNCFTRDSLCRLAESAGLVPVVIEPCAITDGGVRILFRCFLRECIKRFRLEPFGSAKADSNLALYFHRVKP